MLITRTTDGRYRARVLDVADVQVEGASVSEAFQQIEETLAQWLTQPSSESDGSGPRTPGP